MWIYLIVSLLAVLSFMKEWPWFFSYPLAGLTVAIIVQLCLLPQPNKPNDAEYSMPLVPLLPCLGIIGNHALVGSFDITTWIYYAVFLKIGIFIYLTYSVHHSVLETGSRPEYDGIQVINEEII